MRIIVCDDEIEQREYIKKLIFNYYSTHKYQSPEVVVYDSSETMLQDNGNKDIVFLDVEMDGMSGIDAGNILKQENPDSIVIIITAFSDYLDAAMKFNVFRYISKPVNKDRFFRNLSDAIVEYNNLNRKICIGMKKDMFSVMEREIVYIEAMGRNTIIHCIDKIIESDWTITQIKEKLNNRCFYQTHRAFVVNMEYIKSFNTVEIELQYAKEKPILSRRKYSDFKKNYLFYLEGRR